MYKNINPAVIKGILLQMTNLELIEELERIKNKAGNETNFNRRKMLIRLHQYATNILKSRRL